MLLNLTLSAIMLAALGAVQANSRPEAKCCDTCTEPEEMYYSVDVPHGFCGETCLNPKFFSVFKVFESNLTKTDVAHPCRAQFTPVGTKYTEYQSTVSHGVWPIKATLDLYGPGSTDAVLSPIADRAHVEDDISAPPARSVATCHSVSPQVSDNWCNTNCNWNPPKCPANLCKCGGPGPSPGPPPPGPAPAPSPLPKEIRGYYSWNWGAGSVGPSNANSGVAFTGEVSIAGAQKGYTPGAAWCCPVLAGPRFLSLGGGNSAGSFTQSGLEAIAKGVHSINRSQYDAVMFDVEEAHGPSSSLVPAFAAAFAACRAHGLRVGVTTSHSAPYATDTPADAVAFVKAWAADENIDILSPQLYSTGSEGSPEFAETNWCKDAGCTWDLYKGAKARFAPSIVGPDQYSQVVSYFAKRGVTASGFFQWRQKR